MEIFSLVYLTGIIILKITTFNQSPIIILKEKHKDSAIPYFLGFGLTGGLVYFFPTP